MYHVPAIKSIFVCQVVLTTLLVAGSQDWQPWSTLPEPASMQCTVCVIQEAVLMGGRRDDGVSNAIVAISVSNPLVNQELSPSLPIQSTGQFCARAGFNIFASIQGSTLAPVSPTPDYNVYYATFGNGMGGGAYATSTAWKSVGRGQYNRTRTGLGAANSEMQVFMFGGVDSNNVYVNLIEAFNSTSQKWTPVGFMPRSTGTFSTFCNCQTAEHRVFIFLACQECFPQPDERGAVKILQYSLSTFQFIASLSHDFGTYFLSMRSVSLSHYVVLVVSVSNATSPTLYYYDVYQNQISLVHTSDFSEQRSHGSAFPITFNMYFAGGEYANGSLSDAVDQVPALPSITVVPDHSNYTYGIGQMINMSLGECGPGMMVRLAPTPSCDEPIPGVNDAACIDITGNDGLAILQSTLEFQGASICLSMGICSTDATSRVACSPPPTTYPDFESCLYDSCCWDASTGFCFKYSDGPAEERHYFLANSIPLSIVNPSTSDESAFVRFITGVSGIITVVAVALVIIVGGGAVAWRILRSRPDDDDDEEGSGHPLDQHGKYKVLCKLGQGGFGTVYLVARKSDSERFAMKYIVCKDEEERNYAIKEFELLHSSQGHPNMIKLMEMFMNWTNEAESLPTVNYTDGNEDEPTQARLIQKRSGMNSSGSRGSCGASSSNTRSSKKSARKYESQMPLLQVAPKYVCIVMDYCPEGDLAHYILRVYQLGTTVAESMVLDVMLRQCCSLLNHLHNLKPPIVHRDLKPENILLRGNGTEVVVTDFGLAQQIEKSYLTTRAGSLHYVAPECWKRHYTAAVDVWALGCIAYGMCTGRVTAETARVMFSDARDKTFERSIRHDLRGYSEKLRNIVIGMLQPLPAKRLTASQVLEALDSEVGRVVLPAAVSPTPSTLSSSGGKDALRSPQKA